MSVFDGREGLRRSSSYLPELESMRGWAILLVVGFHYFGTLSRGAMGTAPRAPLWLKLIAAGNTGVSLFFVLSGFLLTRPFLESVRSGRPLGIARFYAARLLRILPLYYLVVLTAWAVTRSPETPKAFLFIPIGFVAYPYSTPWWSLTTEMQFYLLLPWAMLLLRHRLGRWVLAALLVGWAAAYGWAVHRPIWFPSLNPWENSVFGRGVAFVAGGAAAGLHGSASFKRFAAARFLPAFALGLTLVPLLLLLRWFAETGQRDALTKMPLYHTCEALLWTGVMLAIVALKAPWKRVLVNPVFDHFGRISYSLFLIHLPVQAHFLLTLALREGPVDLTGREALWRIGASFALSWLFAAVGYQCIERPFLRLKARVPAAPASPSRLAQSPCVNEISELTP